MMTPIIMGTDTPFVPFNDKSLYNIIKYGETVPNWLRRICVMYADQSAMYDADNIMRTYQNFLTDIESVCGYLKNKQYSLGTNIGICCRHPYWTVIYALGVMSYGCVAVMLPNVQAGICYDLVGTVCDTTVPSLTCMREYHQYFQSFANCDSNDPTCIMLTSGTTGRTKGVVLPHRALLCGAINGCYGFEHLIHNVYYCMIPLTHVFGFVRNMLTALYTGSTIYFMLNKDNLLDDLKKYKPTILVVVPALASILLKMCQHFGVDNICPGLHWVICGGADIPHKVAQEYYKLGIIFGAGYGLTESANLVSGNPTSYLDRGSSGFIFPHQAATIQNGELLIKGDNMMLGYYDGSPAFDMNGWFHTGDLAYFDHDQKIYITGRVKNLIVLSNGEKISPEYIEGTLNDLDQIVDSLIIYHHNQYDIEELMVYVQYKPGAPESVTAAVIQTLQEQEVYTKIKNVNIRVVDQIPYNSLTQKKIRKEIIE